MENLRSSNGFFHCSDVMTSRMIHLEYKIWSGWYLSNAWVILTDCVSVAKLFGPNVFYTILEMIFMGGGGLQLVRSRCSVKRMVYSFVEEDEVVFVTACLYGRGGNANGCKLILYGHLKLIIFSFLNGFPFVFLLRLFAHICSCRDKFVSLFPYKKIRKRVVNTFDKLYFKIKSRKNGLPLSKNLFWN